MSTRSATLVHDYLTQRGGAERVVLAMARALDTRVVYTSLFDPKGTFPEFTDLNVRTSWLNRVPGLRSHHRVAFPLLARAFSQLEIDAEVTVCSSSGWAHGAQASGRKIVYCHAPARWLYQTDRYLGARAPAEGLDMTDRVRLGLKRGALALARSQLLQWDKKAGHSADKYLVNSTAVATAVREVYGIEAEVLPPSPGHWPRWSDAAHRGRRAQLLAMRFTAASLQNVVAIVEAMRSRTADHLVVVGSGPDRDPPSRGMGHVTFVGAATDATAMVLRQLSGNRHRFVRGLWAYAT